MVGVKNGTIKTIIVKDHSRLGRNRLVVGTLLEENFENYGVRYIAIMENIDNDKGLSDLVPMQDLFNEWDAKNTSQKVKNAMLTKGNAGIPLTTSIPYGYKKDTDGSKYWLVDEVPAEVITKIFNLCIAGKGVSQIAKQLEREKVPTPTEYWHNVGRKTAGQLPQISYWWSARTVSDILQRLEYLGHTVNFRTHVKSFKNKRKIKNDPTNWVVFENTNVAGKISDDRFERISTTYEIEQKDLQAQVAQLKIELTKEEESVAKSENFITVVKKYTEIKESKNSSN